MTRLIVDNRSNLPMDAALSYARAVVCKGRISKYGTQYCYATVFKVDNVVAYASANKNSDRIVIVNEVSP